ncbi:MAG: hypothetical protein H6Q52_84 [Deltaproteobacteria bacterium]|nr:hypothetical protein [Deltaproteobacteria bacterium]
MCESNVYIRSENDEVLFFDSADVVRVDGGRIYMRSLFGEEKYYDGEIEEILLSKHKIILKGRDPNPAHTSSVANDAGESGRYRK